MPRALALLIALIVAVPAAQAATYKWIGADGQVNYGDRPPHADARALGAIGAPSPAPLPGDPSLPYALRMANARYPVTLFTGRDCEPCEAARAHLIKRGVPFAERLLRTDRDAEAFRKLGFGELAVPAVRVGRETATGYQADAWDRLLDAAGYPKSSQLPAAWRAAPAQPLAATTVSAPSAAAPEMTVEMLNDPANQRDDMREEFAKPAARPVPIVPAPTGAAPRVPAIRF